MSSADRSCHDALAKLRITPPFVVKLSNHERRADWNQRAATLTPFDELRTRFDGLRANDRCSELP